MIAARSTSWTNAQTRLRPLALVAAFSLAGCETGGGHGTAYSADRTPPDEQIADEALRAKVVAALSPSEKVPAALASAARRSRVATGAARPPVDARREFAPVLLTGGVFIVLQARAPAAWATGVPSKLATEQPLAASRPVDETALPAWARQWRGRPVALYGARGRECEGRVGELAILYRAVAEADGSDAGKTATQLTRQTPGTVPPALVAVVSPFGAQHCEGALWARDAGLPAPTVYTAQTSVPRGQRARLLRSFRRLAGYASVQRSFRDEVRGARGYWDGYRRAAAEISVYRDAPASLDGQNLRTPHNVPSNRTTHTPRINDIAQNPGAPQPGRAFAIVAASAGPGCGEFLGAHWAVWELGQNGQREKPVLLGVDEPMGEAFTPLSLVELPGGELVLVGEDSFRRKVGQGFREVFSVRMPSYACSC